MSEPIPEPATPESAAEQPGTSHEEPDWKALARKWESRAKENYEKAQRLDEIEEQSKSEAQRLAERAEAAERRASELERQNLATRLAAEYDVPVEVIHGNDEASMRAVAERVRDWQRSRTPEPPKPARLRSGASGSEPPMSGKERAAAALRQMRQGG